jgi:hypothetical protein
VRGVEATLLVRCRFPTDKGNRVGVVVDGQPAGELDLRLEVSRVNTGSG